MKHILGFFVFIVLTLSGAYAQIEILHIQDSLGIGGFGNVMYEHYVQTYGKDKVVFVASCGASPESYLKGYRNYYTRCGYREITPTSNVYKDFLNGKAPPPTLTPKLEDLIEKYHPKKIVVALGTNWMDGFNENRDNGILLKFKQSLVKEHAEVIWITPPDSSHYPKTVQLKVKNIILNNAPNYYQYIDSSKFTHYTRSSGGDGIHYNDREGKLWAKSVLELLK